MRADVNEGVGLHVQDTPQSYLNGVLTNRPDGKWLSPDELRAIIEREIRKGGASR